MRLGPAVVIALAFAAFPAAAKDSADIASFKSWSVACDNTLSCTAVGVDEGGLSPFVVIKRDGGPDGTARIWVGIAEVDPPLEDKVTTFEAVAKGGPHLARATLTEVKDDEYEGAVMGEIGDPQRAIGFIRALKDAASLELRTSDRSLGEVSLAGSSAALRFMDDRQHRAHTVTALVAAGLAPESFVPPAPPMPHVKAAPSIGQDGLADELPAPIAARKEVKDCGSALATSVKFAFSAKLGPNLYLWGAPCDQGAYNYGFSLYLADRDGRGAKPIPFPEFNDELFNPSFDGATMTLEAFFKGRGLGDCGEEAQWVWDGHAFQPLKRMSLSHCGGVPQSLWPVLYRATRDPAS